MTHQATDTASAALLKAITERAAAIHHCQTRARDGRCRSCDNQLKAIVEDAALLASLPAPAAPEEEKPFSYREGDS